MISDARIEDLEEALRKIVTLVQADGQHVVTERDDAILTVALEALGLDAPPRPYWQRP